MFCDWTGHIKLHHVCEPVHHLSCRPKPLFWKPSQFFFPKPNGIADQRLLNPNNPKYYHHLQNPDFDIRKAILSLNQTASPFAVWLLSERRQVIVVSSGSALISWVQGPTPIYAPLKMNHQGQWGTPEICMLMVHFSV